MTVNVFLTLCSSSLLILSQAVYANTAPVANGQSIIVTQNTLKKITLTGTDADKNKLTYSRVAKPSHGDVVVGSTGSARYTPVLGYYGADSFSFKVNDGKLNSKAATVKLTVKPVNLSSVAQGKKLVSNARTWLNSFAELKTPADAFAQEAEVISSTLTHDSSALIEFTNSVLQQVINALQTAANQGKALPTSITLRDNTGKIVGKASVSAQLKPTTKLIIKVSKVTGVSLEMNATFNQAYDAPMQAWLKGTGILLINGTVQNSKAKVGLTNTKLQVSVNPKKLSTNGIPLQTSASFQGSIAIESLVKKGDKISGTALLELVNLTANKEGWRHGGSYPYAEDNLTLSRVSLGPLTVSSKTGSSAGLTLDFKINNAASFDTFAYLDGKSEIQVGCQVDNQDLAGFTAAAKKLGITKLFDAHYSPNGLQWDSTVRHSYHGWGASGEDKYVSDNKTDAKAQAIINKCIYPSQWIVAVPYAEIGYSSEAAHYGWAGTYVYANLILDKQESANNFLKATFTMQANLALKGYPEATMALSFDRSGYQSAKANLLISHNKGQLDITVNKPNVDSNVNAALTIKDTAGAVLSITMQEGVPVGNLYVDSKLIGVIKNGVIYYNDNTFESLQ